MIILEDVNKSFSTGSPALNNVSLHIEKGEFVFIVGDSGSGKSTLIKLLLRELTPTSGRIMVNHTDVVKLKHRGIPRYRRGIGVVFQDFRLLKDRNVYENVAFAQRVISVPAREIRRNVPSVLSLVGLAEKYKSRPRELSGGEQQMLAIARALMSEPRMIMFDEPSLGLSPKMVQTIFNMILKINKELGTTVLLVEQNVRYSLEISDRAYVIENGEIVLYGPGKELLKNDHVRKAYLGL